MKSIRYICLFLPVFLFLSPGFISAQERLALVIGNGAYSSIGALPNPTADAELIAQSLESVGFKTTTLLDADQYEMKKGIADFGRSLRKSSKDAVGLFFYAGHGAQAQGKNFLLPVEAEPIDAADLDLMAVEADWVLRQMESAGNKSNILILDACRNNPFVASNRSLGRGLAQIDAPTGSFISYATAPGKVALDGDGENSPFTAALAEALPTAGLPIEQIFKKVRIDVLNATGGAQIPWDSSSLVEDLYLVASEDSQAEDSQEQISDTNELLLAELPVSEEELGFWNDAVGSGDASKISLFLQLYPQSRYAQNARSMLKSLVSEPAIELSDKQQDATTNQIVPESELVSRAQTSRQIEDYRAYVDSYPAGTFAEFFRAEISFLESSSEKSTAETVSPQLTPEAAELTVAAAPQPQVVDFATRSLVLEGSDQLRSIEQLSQTQPQFPPFEGLPDSMWKKQDCSNCHAWEKTNLCEQGTFYIGKEDSALNRHKHPFGGKFKLSLKKWANDGCK